MQRAALASAVLLAATCAPARADGSAQLGLSLQFSAPGAGYMVVADTRTDAGTFNVGGLPPAVSISKAYFYCDAVAAAPSVTGATLNGQPLALTWIGTMPATAPNARVHAWRADVTPLFTGAGTYTWTTQSGGTNRGAVLVLLGRNLDDTEVWHVQVRDGAHGGLTADGVETVWPSPVVFDNFGSGIGWPVDAEVTWVVAGGDPGAQERFLIEGVSVAGDDPATQVMSASTWDANSFLTTSSTSLSTSCSEVSDAIVWMVGILHVKVCDNCPRPFCEGDGTGPVPCPCGNTGDLGKGCGSAATAGARITPVGTPRPDTIVVEGHGIVPSALCVLFQGDVPIGPVVFGDGLRCVGGHQRRMYSKLASPAGDVWMPQAGDLSLTARSAALGDPLAPGMTRWYQLYYRDPNETFCTPARFNTSSGMVIPW